MTTVETIRVLCNGALNRGGDFSVINRWLAARQGQTVIDIGTNVSGFVPNWLSAGAGQIHCFEPVPWVFDRLKEAWGHNPLVKLNNLAVSDTAGVVKGVRILNAH